MLTPRFQLPDPNQSPDSLKNKTLILRCQQDPLHVAIKNPTPPQLEALLRHVNASLPSSIVGGLVESLRNETPINRGDMSFVAEVSKATIEEATSLVWNKGQPELTRYVVISSLSEDRDTDDADDTHKRFSGDRFQLTLDRTSDGHVEVALGWENGDCAESLESLNARWKKINEVYQSLEKPSPPWDLLPHATERAKGSHDDEYVFEGLTLVAYPMDPDVILEDIQDSREHEPDIAAGHDDDDEPEDEFGLFKGVTTGESPHVDEEEEDDGDARPESPGDDLTIIDPTPTQLTKIAALSSMPVTKDLIQRLMMLTYENGPITAERFEKVPSKVRESICVHRRATYILDGSLTESTRYSLDECDLNKPTMFTINLSSQKSTNPGQPNFLKSVLHWEFFSPECDVANWERIVAIARKRE